MIKRATPRLAPELMPSIEGPAKGFLKSVCIRNPLHASAAPARIPVNVRGMRESHSIVRWVSVTESLSKRVFHNELSGIDTLPVLSCRQTNAQEIMRSRRNPRAFMGTKMRRKRHSFLCYPNFLVFHKNIFQFPD